jgi:transposase
MAATVTAPDEKVLLLGDDKEELVEEILRLRRKNDVLEKENEELKKRLGKFEATQTWEPKKKPKKRWKKLGRPEGHIGVTRPKPDVIHHVVEQTLDRCPDCNTATLNLLPSQTEEHIQEDIIPAHIEATKFIRYGYWCTNCKQVHQASYHPNEVPYGYLGPNILAHTVLLKYLHGLPYSKIQSVFQELCGLKVSTSGLAQALQRLGKWLQVEEKVILKALRSSPWVHGDETGWKIQGIGHWLWNFVNQKWALYQIYRGRGQKQARAVMTGDYQGVIISDFLSAYNDLGKRLQRCWVHLFRAFKRIRDPSPEEKAAYKKLKRIYRDAKRLDRDRGSLAPWVFLRRLRRVKDRFFDLSWEAFESASLKTLAKRLKKRQGELFTFLEVPGVPSDNNHCERMIRPNVIFRKISFQNMSRKGADAHEILMSVLQSLRLQKKTALPFLKLAYLKHRQGNPTPVFTC